MEHVRTKGNEELRAGVIDHFTMRYASSIQAPQDIGTLDGWDENRCGEQKHSLEIAVTFHSVFLLVRFHWRFGYLFALPFCFVSMAVEPSFRLKTVARGLRIRCRSRHFKAMTSSECSSDSGSEKAEALGSSTRPRSWRGYRVGPGSGGGLGAGAAAAPTAAAAAPAALAAATAPTTASTAPAAGAAAAGGGEPELAEGAKGQAAGSDFEPASVQLLLKHMLTAHQLSQRSCSTPNCPEDQWPARRTSSSLP